MSERLSDEQLWSWVDRDAAELHEHLARHPEDQERVARLREQIGAVKDAVSVPQLPEWIGPYRVTGLLGAGAMGVVYAAVQPNPRREVALKVLRDAAVEEEQRVARFAAECEALGRLQHPCVATVYEAGLTEGGLPFLVMERVHGVPLDEWAKTEPKLERRIEVLAAACDGVEAAHRAGVVHRDLKPAHLLVDSKGQPKIVDFGLARLTTPGSSAPPPRTGHGQLLGTLPWMSPEQLEGNPEAIGPATDVWSLGVILFESVTGRLPFGERTAPVAATIRAITERPAPACVPSTELEDVPEALAEALARICATALQQPVSSRYDSAGDLAADLRRALRSDPISAGPVPFSANPVPISASPVPSAKGEVTANDQRRRRRLVVRAATGVFVLAVAAILTFEDSWWKAGEGGAIAAADLGTHLARGGPALALWSELRWTWAGPEVRDPETGKWAQLQGIGEHSIDTLLGLAKTRSSAGDYRSAFAYEHAALLATLQPNLPLDSIELRLRPRCRVDTKTVQCEATPAKHGALHTRGIVIDDAIDPRLHPDNRRGDDAYSKASAFRALRWMPDGKAVVLLGEPYADGRQYELLELFGMTVEDALALTRSFFGAEDAPRRLAEDFGQVLQRSGYPAPETMHVVVADRQSGARLEYDDVAFNQSNRRALMADKRRDSEDR